MNNFPGTREVLVAGPRGFCAGVERAIGVVERLLDIQATPLYVRKEIVHNRAVVDAFRARGVVFVEELGEVPDGATVVFSAHGISPVVREEAERRGLRTVDATCPLVTRVHRSVVKHADLGRTVVLIGHAGHDEVVGTMGEAPGKVVLVQTVDDVANLELPDDAEITYVTQTTLSVDETRAIVAALVARYPGLIQPAKSDICYATQNRQDAVKHILDAGATCVIVVGSANSSNSVRLCEVARLRGAETFLVDGPEGINPADLRMHCLIGLTAGASAPEHLVQEVVGKLAAAGWRPRELAVMEEDVKFSLPRALASFGLPNI
jgi:4-hydroxy-3-methylbut-2-en-1-yl diphosphate reductase